MKHLHILQNNLKDNNALKIEREYENCYLAIMTLTNQIQDIKDMIHNKENRCSNVSRYTRESRRGEEGKL